MRALRRQVLHRRERLYREFFRILIRVLAVKFKISPARLKEIYLQKIGAKFSVKEKPFEGGFACVFFDEAQRNCGIYELRPKQCRSFPFWEYFKTHTKELEEECIGVRF